MSEPAAGFPFRTTVVPLESELSPEAPPDPSFDDGWSEEDLEALYQQTLEAVDAATEDVSRTIGESDDADGSQETPTHDESLTNASAAASPDPDSSQDSPAPLRVTPRQVVEAVLFVGGGPVTGKQIAELLGGESTHEHVDDLVESLNTLYVDQSRPYEIRLVEGGYQLTLRPEFDRVRHRVFGMGPKEVKLSQDALELLALVAYQQPISKAAIDELGKTNASAMLRQLLRRELISLERDGADSQAVVYRTTARFLELFGLKSLDDLPQVEDVLLR